MLQIKDVFKPSPRKVSIRTKWGTWTTSLRHEVDHAIGHTDVQDYVFMRDTDSDTLRVLLNGCRCNLEVSDFMEV